VTRGTLSRFTGLALAALFAGSLARAESLPEILARMDQAAKEFRSLSGKMKRTDFNAVLNESTDSEGVVRLKKTKNGAIGIVEFQPPEQRTYHFGGRTVEIYYPKAKTIEIYDAGKYTSKIDQILLLGFGTSGVDLNKTYDVKALGTETVGSAAATHLDLAPRSDELKKYFARIELWIPEGKSNPVREKVTQPSKDYSIVDYSEMTLNPSLPDSAFELKRPAGVKEIRPQH
jgi:outer membrane lipoprotein-sorting protein